MSAALLALVVALGQAGPGPAAPAAPPSVGDVELSVALTPESPTVGDRVTAVLTLTAPAGSLDGDPEFPAWGPTWGTAEIFDAGEPRKLAERQGTVTWRQRLELAAFRPGRSPLPPVSVRVPLTGGTAEVATPDDLAVEITSVLPVTPESPPGTATTPGSAEEPPEPRPPEPPQRLPLGMAFWATAAALGAAFLALLLFLWRRRAAAEAPARPRLSPLAELEQRLGALAGEPSPETGHVVLSMALRRYLGRRLGFAAAQSTTTEIRRQIVSRHLPDPATRRAVDVLANCDRVKFAGRREDRDRLAEALTARAESALAAAREVETHLRPPQPPAEASS